MSIAIGLLFALASIAGSYKLANAFYSSNHARTDKSGDFGSARGSAFAVMLPALVCTALLTLIANSLNLKDVGPYVLVTLFGGVVAGFVGAFRAVLAPRKDQDKNQPGK